MKLVKLYNNRNDEAKKNLKKRYGRLFTLPNTQTTLVLIILISVALLSIPSIILEVTTEYFISRSVIISLILVLMIRIEQKILSKNSISNFRRIASLNIFSIIIWLVFILLGSLFYILTSKIDNFISSIVIGMFSSISIRTLILRSVFYDSIIKSTIIALTVPLITLLLIIPYEILVNFHTNSITAITPTYFIGISLISLVIIYIRTLNNTSIEQLKISPFKFLRAFAKAWSSEDINELEQIITDNSKENNTTTKIIELTTNKDKINLVLPGVHPGPIYPVGSSNIPYQIQEELLLKGYKTAVFHGMNSHEFNLTSKYEVKRYLSSLVMKEHNNKHNTTSKPHKIKSKNATASGILFNNTPLIILTLSPKGSDDIPEIVEEKVREISEDLGFKDIILIDSHNSEGDIVDEEDVDELINTTRELLNKLKKVKQYSFDISYINSNQLNLKFREDVGPGGISLFLLKIENKIFGIIIADANNIINKYREIIINELLNNKKEIIEICTSDTHVTAGKIKSKKGYLSLGEVTEISKLTKYFIEMWEIAERDMNRAEYNIHSIESRVNTINDESFSEYYIGVKNVMKKAKNRGILVTIATLLLFTISQI